MIEACHRWIALALACTALASGCGGDVSVTSWVDENRADSEAAERAIADHDDRTAVQHLRAITERAPPRDVAEEDARVVRQDAYDRWARIEIARGDVEQASRLLAQGLALGERDDVFTANLLTTRGRVHEMRGRDREAARDYHRALVIEDGLLDRALGGGE